jgi:hypothetical protein
MKSLVPTSWAPNFETGIPNIIRRDYVIIKKPKTRCFSFARKTKT